MNTHEPQISRSAIGPRRDVLLVDSLQRWARQPADLVGAIIAFLAITIISFLAVYARLTTVAVTSDVREATGGVLETILFFPINALEGIVTFFMPLAILAEMLLRQRWRTLATAVVSAAVSVGLSIALLVTGERWFPQSPLVEQIGDAIDAQSIVTLVPYVAILSALLTVSASVKGSKLVRWGWILLTIVLVLSVLQGNQTLPGALITIFLGIFAGMLTRYVIGATPDRSTGIDLVNLVRRGSIDPVRIVRLDGDDELDSWSITTAAAIGYTDSGAMSRLRDLLQNTQIEELQTEEDAEIIKEIEELQAAEDIESVSGYDSRELRDRAVAAYPLAKPASVSRTYLVTDVAGERYHLLVLDNDRRILGTVNDMWSRLRLKTTFRHIERTLEGTAAQMALMQLRVEQAGITEQIFVSAAHSDESIAILTRAVAAPLLSSVLGEDISDTHLDQFWSDLESAHSQGISHGDLHVDSVRVTDSGLDVTAWHDGSLVSSDSARSIDLAQGISMLAPVVGIERAVESLARSVPLERIVSLAPFLQTSIMPPRTREYYRRTKLFAQLRDALAEKIPVTGSVETVELKRFAPKTIITVSIGVIAVYVLFASVNFAELSAAIRQANPAWMVVAFLAGLFTYVGAGITLKAYTREKVPLGQSILVQVAASLVTLVAPAGIGPAALNLRFLQKKNVATAPALATVTVVQVAQFVTTVVVLAVLMLATGDFGMLSAPSQTMVTTIVVIAAVIVALFLVRPLRQWIYGKLRPTLEQIWPRLVWLATHPQRLAFGLVGSVLMTIAFVACFGFALKSFGYELPLVALAVTFLVSNSIGSLVPSPGGIGPVEAALTGGLVLAGIPYSVAFSTAILYRLFTFWGRVPLGWIALQIATKRNIV